MVTNVKSEWVNGNLVFKDKDGNEILTYDGTGRTIWSPELVHTKRQRFTIAEVNAGATLLAAIAGRKYRMVGCIAIAIGGAVGTLTTVDVLATQSASGVKLVAYAQANLTQSTVLRDGATGATVLANGASYVANDVNTAITVGKTGGTGDTATHIDFQFSYTVEA